MYFDHIQSFLLLLQLLLDSPTIMSPPIFLSSSFVFFEITHGHGSVAIQQGMNLPGATPPKKIDSLSVSLSPPPLSLSFP